MNASSHATNPRAYSVDVNSLRRVYLVLLAVVTPLGIATKFYSGPGATWVSSSAGGFFYVVFWILCVLVLAPRLSSRRVTAGVLLVTCALEFLQLSHPSFLERFRSTFFGQVLIGTTFSWLDFPFYALGALAGYALASLDSISASSVARR
jgi:hypothetical protein